jgi:hypothetical protein
MYSTIKQCTVLSNNGDEYIVLSLYRIGPTHHKIQHEIIKCLKAFMNNNVSLFSSTITINISRAQILHVHMIKCALHQVLRLLTVITYLAYTAKNA